eukprot:1443830-Ditylum_brightwellii.AAC.1
MRLTLDSTVLLLLCGGYELEEFDNFSLVLMLWLEVKTEKEENVYSCLNKLLYRQLNGNERARRLRYISCELFLPVYLSSWRKLLYLGDNDSNIQVKLPNMEEKVIDLVDSIGSKYPLLGQER